MVPQKFPQAVISFFWNVLCANDFLVCKNYDYLSGILFSVEKCVPIIKKQEQEISPTGQHE